MSSDFQKKNFDTEIGQKVRVERDEVKTELAERSNAQLRDIGSALNPYPQALNYKGSLAVHIFESPMLGQIMFVGQTLLRDVPEETASAAISDLRGSAQIHYGRTRQVKRSGF